MIQEDARQKSLGIAAAVGAYVAWGFLSPGGKLLLEYAGPWTINFHRTWLSLLVLVLVFGPRRWLHGVAPLARDHRPWILGVALAATFIPYLYSILYLEPTIAVVLLYLAPLAIAWFAHRYLGEPLDRLIVPTALLTLAGVAIAVFEPFQGERVASAELLGVSLGVLGVAGWCFYTLTLRHLSVRYEERELTLTAFAASGIIFLAGGAFVERLAFDWNGRSMLLLAAYVLIPSVLSFLLYAVAVRKAGAAVASVLIGVELVATAIVSYFLTGETFSVDEIAGLAIVVAAITAFLLHQRAQVRPDAATGEGPGP